MTNDELRRTLTRIADARLARRDEATRYAAAAAPARAAGGDGLAVGDRVFDVRGGREGTVSDVRPTDRGGQPLVYVRFDDGSAGTRDVMDLLARPTRPAGRA